MEEDVKEFVQGCLVCFLSSSGEKFGRPLGSKVYAERVGGLSILITAALANHSTTSNKYSILKDESLGTVFCEHSKRPMMKRPLKY